MQNTKVWNFTLPPFPRPAIASTIMSPDCPVNRLLQMEAGKLAALNQLDIIENREDLQKFQKDLRKKIWKKLGTVYDGKLPLKTRYFGTCPQEGFTIRKLMYQSQEGIFVTALLYIPAGEGPFPAVLLMHGHNAEGKFAANNQYMAASLARNGIVCLSVDARGTYERATVCREAEYHGSTLGASIFNTGETLMGQQVVDNMRGVDLLRSLDFVIKDRIGATGASGGGNQTLWVSAMDERICAAMPVVSIGSFQSYASGVNCVCEVLPDGLTFMEVSQVLALIAPRFLRIGTAYYDGNRTFSADEMLKSFAPVQRLYQALQVPHKISHAIVDRLHGYTDLQRESALGFFLFALKDEGHGYPLQEAEYDLPKEYELHLFEDPRDRPPEVMNIRDINRKRGEELRSKMLAAPSFSASKLRKDLKKCLHLRDLPKNLLLYSYREKDGIGRFVLDTGDHLIPFLFREGSRSPEKVCILLHPDGKAALDNGDIGHAGSDGCSLLLPDLFGCGETAQPYPSVGPHHQIYRQLLWVGRRLIGEWVYDILALAKVLKQEFNRHEISLYGVKECGTSAMLANALSADFSEIFADSAPASLLFDTRREEEENKFSIALNIPGFLRWGDISLVEALGYGPTVNAPCFTTAGYRLDQQEMQDHLREVAALKAKLK